MDIKKQLKEILVQGLNLEDVTTEDIDDEAPLFGEGLGLDSLDAVEIVMLIQRHFHVEIKNADEAKKAFTSINTLVRFIESHQG